MSGDARETAPAPPAMPRPSAAAPLIAPSILSTDFSRLSEALSIVDPALDWVHCDVMDNHFVPNLTFGPLIVAAVRKLSRAFVDVHLMIERPERLLGEFRAAGADQLSIHLEAPHDRPLAQVLATIRAGGMRAGLAIKPGTPFEAAEPLLPAIDLLLVMTVEPGFGGQEFRAAMLDKVRAAAAWRDRHRADFLIEVDGGIAPGTAGGARAAGADIFVAGNAIYSQHQPRLALETLRREVARPTAQ